MLRRSIQWTSKKGIIPFKSLQRIEIKASVIRLSSLIETKITLQAVKWRWVRRSPNNQKAISSKARITTIYNYKAKNYPLSFNSRRSQCPILQSTCIRYRSEWAPWATQRTLDSSAALAKPTQIYPNTKTPNQQPWITLGSCINQPTFDYIFFIAISNSNIMNFSKLSSGTQYGHSCCTVAAWCIANTFATICLLFLSEGMIQDYGYGSSRLLVFRGSWKGDQVIHTFRWILRRSNHSNQKGL